MAVFKKLIHKGLFVLCYHGVTDKEYLYNLSLGLQLYHKNFEDNCKILSNKCVNCSIDEFYESELTTAQNYFYISFDDVYQNIIEFALPILEKYKIKFIIFPSTNFVDKDLFWWDKFRFSILASPLGIFKFQNESYFLRDLHDKNIIINKFEPILALMNVIDRNNFVDDLWSSNLKYVESKFGKILHQFKPITSESLIDVSKNPLCTIGSHGVEHLVMDYLKNDEIRSELLLSKNWLFTNLNIDINSYCFPNGSNNSYSNKIAAEIGYKYGFVINPNISIVNTKQRNIENGLTLINRFSVDAKNILSLISKM